MTIHFAGDLISDFIMGLSFRDYWGALMRTRKMCANSSSKVSRPSPCIRLVEGKRQARMRTQRKFKQALLVIILFPCSSLTLAVFRLFRLQLLATEDTEFTEGKRKSH